MITKLETMLRHNLPAKIAAIFAALLLWGYVMNEQNPTIESSYTVTIAVLNTPSGYQVTQSDTEVKLKVRAPRSLFVSSGSEDFHAYVDLADTKEGKQTVKVQTSLPQGFEVISMSPDTIDVTLDKLTSKSMPVEYITTGSVAQGATLAHLDHSVDNVSVTGPSTLLATVRHVIGYVNLNGQKENFKETVNLVPLDADGNVVRGVDLSDTTGEVNVEIARGLTKKVVSIRAVTGSDLPESMTLVSATASPEKIEVAGTDDVLKDLTSVATNPVPLYDVTSDVKKTAKLSLPDGVTVTNPNVTVSITVKPKEKAEPEPEAKKTTE